MHRSSLHHRVPRAGIDRIDRASTALLTVQMVMHRPRRHETIVLLLDAQRCGVGLVAVSDTLHPDAVLDVVECVAGSAAGNERIGAMVVASVRPDPSADPSPLGPRQPDADRDDVDRWLEMSAIADDIGIELVEWFVIGAEVSCPRDRLGAPMRW